MNAFDLTVFLAFSLTIGFASSSNGILDERCTVNSYDKVATATSECINIIIDNITVPPGKGLELNLITKATLTFQGTITFEKSNWEGPLVVVTGSNVTVEGDIGSILDGLGSKYWDGKGKNGSTKPKFFKIETTGESVIKNINLLNCPQQCVSVTSAQKTILTGWNIDISAGYSAGAENTEGFSISNSSRITVENAVVKNQDVCVAAFQGDNYIFKNLTCSGGYGLSLSGGQISNGSANIVSDVTFSDCTIIDSRNGIHVKTHSEAGTGSIMNAVYKNIIMSNITHYGINIQQEYRNEKSRVAPKGSNSITGLSMSSITGSMSGLPSSMAIFILCAEGECSKWNWSKVSITNSQMDNMCKFAPIKIINSGCQ